MEEAIWKLFVGEVRLSPDGEVNLPEGAWIALPCPWECDVALGEKIILPEDGVSRVLTPHQGGIQLELVQGGIMQAFAHDKYKQEVIPSGVDAIVIPAGARLTFPGDQKSLHVAQTVRVPAGTKVTWPRAEVKGKDTIVKTRRGPTFLWLPDGGSLVLKAGGSIRAMPTGERAKAERPNAAASVSEPS